ncbi:hypothetical protein IRJ41_022776 [Triplophysa rosa]|uniref:Uncharacterized protein n=1 Tax=Triplophysa rosa TaxID=992332 RepID=A0A9W7WRX7_TRIRA|nr:hypothetical protein IRJ41_022776 [Triplophysa rosa]
MNGRSEVCPSRKTFESQTEALPTCSALKGMSSGKTGWSHVEGLKVAGNSLPDPHLTHTPAICGTTPGYLTDTLQLLTTAGVKSGVR